MRSILIAFIVSIILSGSAMAQQQAVIGCIDKPIRMQAEDLKLGFTKHGMESYKDANISMESAQPYPVAVQLNKGVMYQMIFVGSPLATDITLELFDGEDKKIGGKEMNKNDPNYIIFSFIPEKTDVYLVVLSQRLKHETLCSSFTILQPATVKKELSEQQGTVPSDNRYNNPRYIDKNGQQKNTTTPPPAYKPYQKSNSSNAQPNTTNPRYVAPAAEKKPQPKTDENYNNPRYKPHGKQ